MRNSLRLDIGRPDHLGPLFSFLAEPAPIVRGRADDDATAQVGKPQLPLQRDCLAFLAKTSVSAHIWLTLVSTPGFCLSFWRKHPPQLIFGNTLSKSQISGRIVTDASVCSVLPFHLRGRNADPMMDC